MSLPARWPNTSRTCRSTAINKPNLPPAHSNHRRRSSGRLRLYGVALLLFLPLAACTSIRPIVKIGLLAPFEGLYRDSGYAALAGMRAAIEACAPPGFDVLPLALDDGGTPAQARRSAEKLAADPAVVAVVGPLLYPLIPEVGEVLAATALPWQVPPTVLPAGDFAHPQDPAWLTAQVEFVQHATRPARLLVVGIPPTLAVGWQPRPNILRLDDPTQALAQVQAGDVILWLGRPDAAVPWLAATARAGLDLNLWLGGQAGGEIVAQQLPTTAPFHWVHWRKDGYTDWPRTPASAPPIGELTYQATCAALSEVTGAASSTLRP